MEWREVEQVTTAQGTETRIGGWVEQWNAVPLRLKKARVVEELKRDLKHGGRKLREGSCRETLLEMSARV